MKSFKEYNISEDSVNEDYLIAICEYVDFLEHINEYEEINESWIMLNGYLLSESGDSKFQKMLSKLGLHAHKTGPGLFDNLKTAGKGMLKFFTAAIKGDKKAIQKMAGKEISKEQVIDFLIKLDTATLHLISGPIHTIEAITGWHIGANIKKSSSKIKDSILHPKKAIVNTIKHAFDFISKKIQSLKPEVGEDKSRIMDYYVKLAQKEIEKSSPEGGEI